MIGICINTHQRPQALNLCLKHIAMFHKISHRVWVVDDNSNNHEENKAIVLKYRDKGLMINYHYNAQRLGIAKSKNIGIEKLKGCDHYFLFDDDIFPIANNWWKPYIRASEQTGNHHLQYIVNGALNNNLKKTGSKYCVEMFNVGSGCLMFFTKQAIEKIIGFNKNYGLYSYEHTGTSIRANKLGLTPYGTFLVPKDAKKYFHSLDMQGIIGGINDFSSSISKEERELAMNDENTKKAYKEDLETTLK